MDIPRIVKEAFYIAQTGRPGPVVIDMPKDVQESTSTGPETIELRGYNPNLADCHSGSLDLDPECQARPVLYCGGGIISPKLCGTAGSSAPRSRAPLLSWAWAHSPRPTRCL